MKHYFSHSSSIVDDGSYIGINTKIWHFTHISSGAKIGDNCVLGQNVFVSPKSIIGNNVKIQNNVSIYDSVEIEDDVFCGPSCVFTNVKNPRAFVERKDEFLKTLVKKGTTIGANATIICGIEIGEYSMIGAGSTITKDVKAHSLIYGSPAKFKGWVSHAGEVLGKDLICPRDKTKYKILDNKLIIIKE